MTDLLLITITLISVYLSHILSLISIWYNCQIWRLWFLLSPEHSLPLLILHFLLFYFIKVFCSGYSLVGMSIICVEGFDFLLWRILLSFLQISTIVFVEIYSLSTGKMTDLLLITITLTSIYLSHIPSLISIWYNCQIWRLWFLLSPEHSLPLLILHFLLFYFIKVFCSGYSLVGMNIICVEGFDFLLWRILLSFLQISTLGWTLANSSSTLRGQAWYFGSLLFLIKEVSIISSTTFTFSLTAFVFIDNFDFDEELDFALDFELCFALDFELHLDTWSDFLDFSSSFNQLCTLCLTLSCLRLLSLNA